jgi:hypothetical protein
MPVGDPGLEQFRNAIMEFRNGYIIAAMAPLIDFRGETILNDEFMSRGGLDSTTQQHLMKHLQNCDKWRRCITYNPNNDPLEERVKAAIDPANLIGGGVLTGQPSDKPLQSDLKPFGGDEVQSAPGNLKQVPWALDGTNKDIPLNSALSFRSSNGLLLLGAIDEAIVAWTRLESRFNTRGITVFDSMQMYGMYVTILDYLRIFAGDKNRVPFAAGVLPSEEPRGEGNSPNMAAEVAGKSGVTATNA